jgi:hypothetical protein
MHAFVISMLNFVVESDATSTVAEMDRMPHVRVGWVCGLHRCIRKQDADAAI